MFALTTDMLLLAGAGTCIGLLFASVIASVRLTAMKAALRQTEKDRSELKSELASTRQVYDDQLTELGELRSRASQMDSIVQESRLLKDELKDVTSDMASLNARYQAQSASFAESQRSYEEKISLLEAAEQRLHSQFETLANRIFDQKSERFSKLNENGMNALLTPLKEQLESFRQQIGDQHIREGQERASLKTEILSLKSLNQKITEEAAALTMALKGDNKKQGNWGEVVLERILKESGLREGHEFETQMSMKDAEGKRYQPDVVVHLPHDKDVVIDSKVSLAAYERYFNTDDDALRKRYLNEHISSLRNHIKGLSLKDYQNLDGVKTLDYVLLFVPVEPAFLLAIEADPELVTLALNHNVMLVSPTNLLVALRTINNIWQYEYQNQNAQIIAQHAAKLYDKFAGFVGDMEKVGKSLDATQRSYELALNKLSLGKGNLIRQVEYFRELGVQPAKSLPQASLLDQSDAEDE